MSDIRIADTVAADLPALGTVVAETGLFPADMLPGLVADHLAGATPDIWLTCHTGGGPVGLCLAVPEPMTDRTWNMRALAILPSAQRHGCGAALVTALARRLSGDGQRFLVVDTSGAPGFASTRAFYARQRYAEVAKIGDLWAEGDDKVTFRKLLAR